MKLAWYYKLLVFTLCVGTIQSMAQPIYKSSNAQFIGVANDTVFYAGTSECYIYFIGGKNEFEIVFPTQSIVSDRPEVDSIFHHINGPQIKITGKVNESIFKLYQTQNSEKDETMEGDLTMNNKQLHLHQTYRIYGNSSGRSANTNLFLNLRLYFDPAYFKLDDKGTLSNPLEFIIQGGYINQKN